MVQTVEFAPGNVAVPINLAGHTAGADALVLGSIIGEQLPLGEEAVLAVVTRDEPFLSRAVLTLVDQAVVSATNFVASLLIGRFCLKEELGLYFLAISLVYFLRGIQEQIVSVPYTVYSQRRDGDRLSEYTGSVVVHQIGGMLGVELLLAAVVAGFVATGMSAEFTEILTVLIVWLPFLLVREFVRSLAFARFRLVAVLLLDVVASAVQVGILLVLAERNTLNSQTAFAASGIACIVGCGCWCLANRPRLRIDLRSVLPDWLHNWSFSRWTLASQLVGCTTPYLLPWLLAGVRGEAATGVYAACSTLVGAANMFVLGLAHFLSPRAAAAYAAGGVPALKRVLAWIATLYVVVLGAFTVLLAVAGNSLLTLIYGDRFTGAGAVAAVLAATMLANSLGMTAGNGLWALDQPSANFRADVCALVVTLFAAAMLIVPCGACGAALAMLIGTGSGAVVRCLILYRRMQQENV